MSRSRLSALVIGGALALVPVSVATPAFADTTVNARPPVFVDQPGSDNDSYVVPSVTGVSYYMDSVKINSGTRKVDAAKPFVEVFTAADPGFTLGAPATWSHQYLTGSETTYTVDGKEVPTLEAALAIQAGRTPSTASPSPSASSTPTTSPSTPTTGGGSTRTATTKAGGYRTAKLGDLTFGAQNLSPYSSKVSKPSNGKYVSVEVSVRNDGSAATGVFPQYSVDLVDKSGNQFTYDPASNFVDPSLGNALDSVNPGNTVRGKLAFDVKKDFKATAIEFREEATGEVVVIPLTSDPSASDDELPHTGLSDALPVGGAMLALAVGGGLLWRRTRKGDAAA